jgi:hypothetical protein
LKTHYLAAFNLTDPFEFARIVANGGYATIGAQKYFAVLSSIIQQLEMISIAAQIEN